MKNFSPQFVRTAVLVLVVAGLLMLALSGFLNPLLKAAFNPLVGVQEWVSSRYVALVEFVTMPRDVASMRDQITELESKVTLLENENISLSQQLRESQIVSSLVEFARKKPDNEYVAANVIGRDPSPYLAYVLINRGSDDGLRRGMPVVTQNGLVGRVDAVTANAARVQLITDASSAVNVVLQSTQTDAMLQGSINGEVSIEMIPQETTLRTGDLVLTSGLGGSYPADIVIGQVVSIRKRPTDLFQSATIQPAANFSTMRAVLVIKNFQPVDIVPLIPVKP